MNAVSAFFRFFRTYTTRFFRVCLVLLLGCGCLLLLSIVSPTVADALNRTVCHGVRVGLGTLTSLVPFSVGELLLFLIPTALTFAVVWLFVRSHDRASRIRVISSVLAIGCLAASMQTLTLGIAYRATPLEQRLSLTPEGATAEELLSVAEHLRDEAHALLDEITFDENGSSVMPYDTDTLSDKLMDAYARVEQDYPDAVYGFTSRIKPVVASRVMSYAHIIGVYTFFSGESNLNVDYHDYNFPFTSAHEFSHQSGVAPEEAANFMAHLVCIASDDAYIRYSGYANLLVYVMNAYYRAVADADVYATFYYSVDERLRGEFHAESVHSQQYDTAFGELSSDLNDLYLKANGTEGRVSYGFVVDLAVAFYKDVE